jgi:four helix bundle protein
LVVYQKARDISRDIYHLTTSFPPDERYSLTDQIRRSSRSIGAQIAEAWAKRRYEKHFVSKLSDADGEQMETQHWIGEGVACGYLDEATGQRLCSDLDSVGKMLNRMMLRSADFCQEDSRALQESRVDYGTVAEFFSPASGLRAPVIDHQSPITAS